MLVGVDLDDTLADFIPELAAFHNARYGTNLTKESFHSYRFWEVWGGSLEENQRKVKEFFRSLYCPKILPVTDSVECVDSLSQRHKLVIISSRPDEGVDRAKDWINLYFSDRFSGIYFTTPEMKKSDICEKTGVEVLIDDSATFARYCASKNTRVLLLDQPWNRDPNLPKEVTRVYSWKEITEII